MDSTPPSITAASQPRSEIDRIWQVFLAPSRAFEDLNAHPTWWVAWLLVVVALTAFYYTADRKIGFATVVDRKMTLAPEPVQRRMAVPPDQREQIRQQQIRREQIAYVYLAWLFHLIGGLAMAAIFVFVFASAGKVRIPFRKAVAVVFYASLPRALLAILGIVRLVLSINLKTFDLENPIPIANLAVFSDAASSGTPWAYFWGGFDLFAIWIVILLGIGFAQQAPTTLTVQRGVITVAALYGLWIFGRTVLAVLLG